MDKLISIHTLRVEGDAETFPVLLVLGEISIHTLRVEGDFVVILRLVHNFISIHTLRVEGDRLYRYQYADMSISIHTLRVEGDLSWVDNNTKGTNFYPHPPCGG